jgi:chromosome segregation ATPase
MEASPGSECADPTQLAQKLGRLVETSRRQAETIARLEQKVLLAEQTIRAAEDALTLERSMRDELEKKNTKKSETIQELESFRGEMEKELSYLRDQLKDANSGKATLAGNFDTFTESAKTEIRSLKEKLDEFAKKIHHNEIQRINEKLAVDQHVGDLNMRLNVYEEQINQYKTQMVELCPDVYIAKATALDQQLASLHVERSEEKAALAALLKENNAKLKAALEDANIQKAKCMDAELRLNEIVKENAFLRELQSNSLTRT